MAYYSAFQSSAFQSNAFQIRRGTGTPVETTTGRPGEAFTYIDPYQKLRQSEEKNQKIKKEKSDLEKLESVLKENQRKQKLAAESKETAQKTNSLKRAIELEALENEYLNEINRLIMMRGELMRRIRADDDILAIMAVAKKRRLRLAA